MSGVFDAIVTKVRMMLGRGVLNLVNDAAKMQTVQVSCMAGETLDDVERPQPYGLTSNPLPGAEAFMAFLGGDRSHGVALVIDDRRYRLKPLGDGEVALYSHEGHNVTLKNGRVVEVNCDTLTVNADTEVSINTPSFKLDADSALLDVPLLSVLGVLQADADIVANFSATPISVSVIKAFFNVHAHVYVDDGATALSGPSTVQLP